MKYIKYLTMVLLVGMFTACSDRDVTFDTTLLDSSTKAYVQIFNMAPIANSANSYAFMVEINGVEYQNDLASILLTRNGIPSGGTNLFFGVDAGELEIKLYGKEYVIYDKAADGSYSYRDRFGEVHAVKTGDVLYAIAGDNITLKSGEIANGAFTYAGEDLENKFVRDEKYNATERVIWDYANNCNAPYYVGRVNVQAGKRYHVFIHDLVKIVNDMYTRKLVGGYYKYDNNNSGAFADTQYKGNTENMILNGAPIAVEMDEIPAMKNTTNGYNESNVYTTDPAEIVTTDVIGEGVNIKFYNFMYEDKTTPFRYKLQAFFKNQLLDDTDENGVHRVKGAYDIPCGKPFGFGEACEWTTVPLRKSVYNSSAYNRMDFAFKVVDDNGNIIGDADIVGTASANVGDTQVDENGWLYTYNAAGSSKSFFWDYYSTYYIGRAYMMFAVGVRKGGTTGTNYAVVATPRWTSQ